MSVEENKKSAYRCFEELWNKRNLSLIPEVIAEDYDDGNVKGVEGFKNLANNILTSIPDIHFVINDVFGEGDKLAISLTATGTQTGKVGDTEPTGESINSEVVFINRYVDGKCVEATSYTRQTSS